MTFGAWLVQAITTMEPTQYGTAVVSAASMLLVAMQGWLIRGLRRMEGKIDRIDRVLFRTEAGPGLIDRTSQAESDIRLHERRLTNHAIRLQLLDNDRLPDDHEGRP